MAEATKSPTPIPTGTAPQAVRQAPADDKPPRSPANRGIRTIVAAVFVAVWLIVVIYDFFVAPNDDVIPLWFQATGLLVLGYLLGLSMDDLRR